MINNQNRPTRFFLERNNGTERIYIGHSHMPNYGFCFAFIGNINTFVEWKAHVKKKIGQKWNLRDSEFNILEFDDIVNFAIYCNSITPSGFFERHRDKSGFRFAQVRDNRKEPAQ